VGIKVEPLIKEHSSVKSVTEQWHKATLAFCDGCRLYVRGKTASAQGGKCGKCQKGMQYAMDFPGSQRYYSPWVPWSEPTSSEELPDLKFSYAYCGNCQAHYDPLQPNAALADRCRNKSCLRAPLIRARACDMVIEPHQWQGDHLDLPAEVRLAAEATFAAEVASVVSAETASEVIAPDFGQCLIEDLSAPSAPGTPRDEGAVGAASGTITPESRAAWSRWREKEAVDRKASQRIFQSMSWKDDLERQAREVQEEQDRAVLARRVKLEEAERQSDFTSSSMTSSIASSARSLRVMR